MNKTKSKTKRYIWIAIGVIILAVALTNVVRQGIAKKRASDLLDALLPVLPASTQLSAEALSRLDALPPGKSAVINGLPVIGELLVPTLDVDTVLIEEYSKANLKQSPCVISGSPAGRDLIVAGADFRSHLGGLNVLTEGDTVMICDLNGRLFLYDVVSLDFADREHPLDISGGCDLSLYCLTANGSARYAARCILCE